MLLYQDTSWYIIALDHGHFVVTQIRATVAMVTW